MKNSVKVKLMPLSSKVKIEDIASDLESRFEKTTKRFQNSSECRQILRKIIVDLSEENWKSLYKEIIGIRVQFYFKWIFLSNCKIIIS